MAMTGYPGLQDQPGHSTGGPVVQALRQFLRVQFGRPSGFIGNIAGCIMARTASNSERIAWTLSLLSIQPTDRILEVGFGPGIAIGRASDLARQGLVAGIDHSDVMLLQAGKRNASAIREGRVMLKLGSASRVPDFPESFDKVFTINSIHFWNEPVACLTGLREKMKPGGRIAVTVQPRSRGATTATTRSVGEEIVGQLSRAGFTECRLEIKAMKPVASACVLGINPQ